MSPLLGGKKKNPAQPYWTGKSEPKPAKTIRNGWFFTLKGSPRHYDDVLFIIDSDPGANVYFGEALTYERGAGVALWRVNASSFDWLPRLYAWWAEAERVEPILFTFHLYFPDDLKYPALDLRGRLPEEVEAFIRANAPQSLAIAQAQARRQ